MGARPVLQAGNAPMGERFPLVAKKLAFGGVRKPRYCEAPSYVGNNSRLGRRFAARLPNTVVANIN